MPLPLHVEGCAYGKSIQISHVTRRWVMSHLNASCHTYMTIHNTTVAACQGVRAYERRIRVSRVTHEWVISHTNELHHTWMSHVTHKWVISHLNESCHIRNITCHAYMSVHDTMVAACWGVCFWEEHINKSRHTWMSHVTYKCVTSHDAHVHPRYHGPTMGWLRLVGSIQL